MLMDEILLSLFIPLLASAAVVVLIDADWCQSEKTKWHVQQRGRRPETHHAENNWRHTGRLHTDSNVSPRLTVCVCYSFQYADKRVCVCVCVCVCKCVRGGGRMKQNKKPKEEEEEEEEEGVRHC